MSGFDAAAVRWLSGFEDRTQAQELHTRQTQARQAQARQAQTRQAQTRQTQARDIARAALAACALLAAGGAQAADLSANQIVQRNVAARGGASAWHAVHTLALSGKMDLGKPAAQSSAAIELAQRGTPSVRKSLADAGLRRMRAAHEESDAESAQGTAAAPETLLPFTLEMKRPHMTRLELEFNKQAAVQTFDGTTGWKLRPYVGRRVVEPMSPRELKAASTQEDLDGMLIDHAAKGTQVAFEQTEPVDGRPSYRLRLKMKNGEVRHVWIDAQTFLENKVDTPPRRVDGVMRTVSTYYRDYKPVNGLMIPFVIETRVDGAGKTGKILVESVQVNPKLDDSRFGKPA